MRILFDSRHTTHVTRHTLFLVVLILIGSFVFFLPVQAEDIMEQPTEVIQEPTDPIEDTMEEIATEPLTEEETLIEPPEEQTATLTPETANESSPTTTTNLATITIHLQIETYDATLYNQDILVTECAIHESSTTTSLTPYCALQQIDDLDIVFANYGGDARFLSKINNYDGSDWNWWAFFHNFDFANEAINEYPLNDSDNILFTYGTWPLKLGISSSTPELNSTTTITIKEFGFDDSWQASWLDSNSSTLVINDEETVSTSGSYELKITTTTPYQLYGKKIGFINTNISTLTPTATTLTSSTEENANDTNSDTGGGNSETKQHNNLDNQKAINFLSKNENNGILGSSVIYTDWTAIAFGAYSQNHQTAQNIKKYLLTNPNALVGLNKVSDYARRAMALMSLGINPYSDTDTNYITSIVNQFDGTQFGDPNLYNDDIFAIIPLLHAGYNSQDEIIYKTVEFILSKQVNNGWGSIDLTAATVQSLSILTDLPGVADALVEAKTKLQKSQAGNGGFGNTPATAWAMQAIATYGENQYDWEINSKNPGDYLYDAQASDGGVDESISTDFRIWNTSYAIPASLDKSWHDILQNFTKQNYEQNDQNAIDKTSSNISNATTDAPTSTIENLEIIIGTPTTTLDHVNTSTLKHLNTSTTENIPKNEEPKILSPIKKVNSNNNPPSTSDPAHTKQTNQSNNTAIEQYNNDDLATTSTRETKLTEQTLSSVSTTTIPYNKTAKGVFAGATSMAGALGLYLGWRFLQTLI